MASRSGGAFLTSLGGDLQKLGPQYAASKQMEFENIAELAKQERLESFEIMKMGLKHTQDKGLLQEEARLREPDITWQEFSVTNYTGAGQKWKVGYYSKIEDGQRQWYTIDQNGDHIPIEQKTLEEGVSGAAGADRESASTPPPVPDQYATISISSYEEAVAFYMGPPLNLTRAAAETQARALPAFANNPLGVDTVEEGSSVRTPDVDSAIVEETGLSQRASDLLELSTQNSDAGLPDVFNDISDQVADEISSSPGAAPVTIIEVVLEEWNDKLTASQKEDLQYYREMLISLYGGADEDAVDTAVVPSEVPSVVEEAVAEGGGESVTESQVPEQKSAYELLSERGRSGYDFWRSRLDGKGYKLDKLIREINKLEKKKRQKRRDIEWLEGLQLLRTERQAQVFGT